MVELLATLPAHEHPEWCKHVCDVVDDYLRQTASLFAGRVLYVNVWADFVGMATEMESLEELVAHLGATYGCKVEVALYQACESNRRSMQFVKQNWQPKHTTTDAFDRNWEEGTLVTETGEWLEMPVGKIDIYVAGFPCAPWSRRGKQLGFDDKQGPACFAVCKTINKLQPAFFILENVLAVGTEEASFEVLETETVYRSIIEYFERELVNHTSVTLRGVDPTHTNFPMSKTRLFQVGQRRGVGGEGALVACLSALISNPMPIEHNYRQFLNLPKSRVDFTRFMCLPTEGELQALAASQCTCSLSPMEVCTLHPCRCGLCSVAEPLVCGWRAKAVKFVVSHFGGGLVDGSNLRKLTYCQVVELSGQTLSNSPRERNLLNIIANLPRVHPLSDTLAVFDLSQSIDRISISTNGTVPTSATNSSFICLCDGHTLNVMQIGYLMGHKMAKLDYSGISAAHLKHMLGMSFHVSSVGLCLAGILAAVGS